MSPVAIALGFLPTVCSWAAAAAPRTAPENPQATFVFEPTGFDVAAPDRALSGFANLQASFQTIPAITERSAEAVAKAAIDSALANPALSGPDYDPVRHPARRYAILDYSRASYGATIRVDKEWRVLAPNEEIAAIFIVELVRIHNEVALEEIRKERDEAERELASLTEQIEKYDAQIADLVKARKDLGVFWMGAPQVHEAASELQREMRRGEIDIAGLKAQLDSINSRLESWYAQPRDPADRTTVDSEVLRAVLRMQVEVEIELAGKLARQKAIEEEIASLRLGSQRQAEYTEADKTRKRAVRRLRELEQLIDVLEAKMQALQTQPCEVSDGRVRTFSIHY